MPTAIRRARERQRAQNPNAVDEWRNPVDLRDSGALLPPDDTEPEQSPSERVAALLSDVTDDDERAVVKVLRQNDAGRFEFCDDYTPSDFEQGGLAMIRRQWGPGVFRICLYGYAVAASGRRSFAIRKREDITLAKTIPGAEPPPSLARAAVSARDPEAPPAWLPLLLERLAPIGQPAAPQPDALEQFKSMLGMFTMMREAMGITPQQKSTIGEVVDAVRELRDVAGEFSGEKPAADPLMATVGQIVELVRASLGQPGAAAGVQPVQPVQLPAPLGIDAARSAPGEGAGEIPATEPARAEPGSSMQPSGEAQVGIAVLVGYLRALFVLAAQGKPVSDGVDLVVEKLPDDFIDLLAGPSWWELLSGQFPEALPHQAWLTKVRDESVAEFAQLAADAQGGGIVEKRDGGAAPA